MSSLPVPALISISHSYFHHYLILSFDLSRVVEASGVMVHWLGRSGWGLSGRGHGSESETLGAMADQGSAAATVGSVICGWRGRGEEEGVHRPVGL